ncbi:uncharacterized protein LOC100893601 [Strongylocentrotus purpuratus]|uniref:CCZ1/INTU/HSP4 first Longin domain-containing protein n=1 Tax=Strongylocentrotus purpuratus TaxID=7668 RepID=A0A7M7PAN1_STRPU|nr:uncharacterized protein LOC100893601 [Strongylocentrotus purpuratus]
MDRRRLDQLFFIYDHSVVQREADDPKDAIAYFYPQNFPIDTQCLLCGQLMGMVNFMKILCSSEPRIYKLRKMKLATLHEGNFTLALAHDPKVSDTVAIGMMRNLYDVFCMYHGSFTRLLKHCRGNRETFSSQMSSIWNCYLPFIRHYGNSMKTIFHAVPTIELPKKCGQIFLKCSHLLQWLKQKPWLLAGCLLYKNKVLCSQLTSDLMRRLLLVKASQNPFPGEKITTDFDLPFGVRILSIYLHEEEYKLFAKQDSAINVESGEGDAMSEEASAMVETSQRREGSTSREGHPQQATPPPHLPQLKEDGSNMCNIESSESDAGQRTSSSPESSDDIGQFTETSDAGMDSERHHAHHGNEGDKSKAVGSSTEGESRTKSPLIASRCRGNGDVKENGRQEHLCGDAKVTDVTHVEAKGTIGINEYGEGRENKENIDRHNKVNHEHSKQGATSIAFYTKDNKVNGIINHHEDIICREHHVKNFSSRNGGSSSSVSKDVGTESIDGSGIGTIAPSLNIASYNDQSCSKTAEKDHSGAAGTFSNAVISTAVSELSAGGIDGVLLPKVEVNYDGGNLEDEPFEIHINPLDSESSPEHSDSSGNAVMSRQRLEPLADDNGNILLQDDTERLDQVDVGADESRQAAGLENGADGRTFRNVQESVTLSQNNSHSRDSLSQEPTPVMQQLSRRASGEQQPSFRHSYTVQQQGTEPNPAKHEGNMDYSSVPEYSTPNASRNPSRSQPSDASAAASRQHDWTHHGTDSALHTDNSDHTKQSNSHAAQSTNDQGPGYRNSPVLDQDSHDLHRDTAASDQPEDSQQSPTGILVRADGTRRRGWTRSRSSLSVTSPTPGKKGVSQGGSEEETTKVEGMVNVSLYVQAHSDVMLIFLGEKDWIQDKSRLRSMWQSFVIKLADLELELQQVLGDKATNQEQDQLYNFLQFSPYEKSVKTNTTSVMTTQNREFVNVVDAMHETFLSKEHVSHLVMRGQHSTVIGSQNDAYQTYFQPLKAQSNTTTSTSSLLSSSSSSSPSSASSSPVMQAATAMATRQGKLEVQAEKMLLKDHGIRFI